jgi:hypothetical protein
MEALAPLNDQAVNLVAKFTSSDYNGVMIQLPAVGPMGTTSLSGTMTIHISEITSIS